MATSVRRRRLIIAGVLLALVIVLGWLVRDDVLAWYQHRQARAALVRRDFPAARERLNRCLNLAPTNAEYLTLAAQTARREGDLTEASRLLGKAFTAKADPAALRMERRLLRLQSGDLEDANQLYNLCIERSDLPDTRLVLEALIVGSLRALQLSLARRSIDLWMEKYPDTPDQVQGWIWRGDEAIRRGSHETALPHYRKALELDPGSDQARQRAVDILVRYDALEALDHLQTLREKRPNDPALRLLLARCRRSLGEHEEARTLLDSLVEDSPKDIAVLIERGQLELDLRHLDSAERWFRQAEALAPHLRDPNLALARCLQLAGKEAEAEKYRQRVARIDDEVQKQIDKLFGPKPSNK